MLGQEEPALTALKKAADSQSAFDGKDVARKRIEILAIDTAAATPATRGNETHLKDQPNDPVALFKSRPGETRWCCRGRNENI
jgi:hypothetical protein